MKSITSAANATFKAWLRLAEHPREARAQGRALAEGLHLAQAALEAAVPIEAALLRHGAACPEAARLADQCHGCGADRCRRCQGRCPGLHELTSVQESGIM